ncbi:MAG TPA: hypothetical protein VNO50_21985 [Pyrinomonadaceae bacterium]|nr:hypothetical protein [Pyrinomonadaceae bacterium]
MSDRRFTRWQGFFLDGLRGSGKVVIVSMSRFIFMTFVFVSFAVLAFAFVFQRSGRVSDLSQPESTARSDAFTHLTFRPVAIFDGDTEDGNRMAETFYKCSDCSTISSVAIFFKSGGDATRHVEVESMKASVVLERSAVTNEAGQHVGDRVVLQFDANPESKAHAEVVWNKDKDFHSLTGPSLEHVLEFEKAFKVRSGRILSRIDDVQKVSFDTLKISDGRTQEGLSYSERQFRSSDCETVIVRTEYFSSPLAAQAKFHKKLSESTTILERGLKFDETGHQVGERSVAMFKPEVQSENIEDTIVAWTENSELHSIQGSFTHVIEFEKRNYRSTAPQGTVLRKRPRNSN